MALEPYTIILESSDAFDGSTPIAGSRDVDFEQDGRTYRRVNLSGPQGIVPADFWGLFTAQSPKLVSISGGDLNPLTTVWPVSENQTVREVVDLRPGHQTILLHPNDRLAIRTTETTRPHRVELVINDVGEADHVAWARRYGVEERSMRFRITRTDGLGFTKTPAAAPIVNDPADWTWNEGKRINAADTSIQGPVLVSAFSRNGMAMPGGRLEGAEVFVRFTGYGGAGTGKVFLVEGFQRYAFEVESGLAAGQWSKPIHVGFDDHLCFETPTPDNGNVISVDIEVGPPRHRK